MSSAAGSRSRELAGLHVVLWTMIRKQALLMIRYRFNFAMQIVGMYLTFAVIFFGGQVAASQIGVGSRALSSTLEGIIVGWFLWTAAQAAYSGLQSEVTSESQWGTLEQLYISPYGFGWIMSLKSVVNVLLAVFFSGVLLALMMVTTWTWLQINLLTIVPILLFGIMSALGVGFAVGGLALIYKRVSGINNIINFAFLGLIAAPVADVQLLRLFPLVQGSAMLQEAMRNGVPFWAFSPLEIGLLVGTGVTYLLLGYLVFRYASGVARKRGVMGHY